MKIYEIRAERQVPLTELTIVEATVLGAYFIPAESEDEALDEFWTKVPVEIDGHFQVSVLE